MKNKITIFATFALTVVSMVGLADSRTTYRDAYGRLQGTKK